MATNVSKGSSGSSIMPPGRMVVFLRNQNTSLLEHIALLTKEIHKLSGHVRTLEVKPRNSNNRQMMRACKKHQETHLSLQDPIGTQKAKE